MPLWSGSSRQGGHARRRCCAREPPPVVPIPRDAARPKGLAPSRARALCRRSGPQPRIALEIVLSDLSRAALFAPIRSPPGLGRYCRASPALGRFGFSSRRRLARAFRAARAGTLPCGAEGCEVGGHFAGRARGLQRSFEKSQNTHPRGVRVLPRTWPSIYCETIPATCRLRSCSGGDSPSGPAAPPSDRAERQDVVFGGSSGDLPPLNPDPHTGWHDPGATPIRGVYGDAPGRLYSRSIEEQAWV